MDGALSHGLQSKAVFKLNDMNPDTDPVILDGGLSNVLEGFDCDLDHDLWSARLIYSDPESIIKAHFQYLEAGADCITTSSYQASIEAFLGCGFSEKESENLLLKSVELAEKARDQYYKKHDKKRTIQIAASFGPYGAFLANGAEYTGIYEVNTADLREFHSKKIAILEKSNADIFAFETMPNLEEIKILADLTDSCAKPSWLSVSCKNDILINDGNLISDAAGILNKSANIFAIGVNCTAPKYISNIIRQLKETIEDKRIIVYPNSGEVYQADTKSWLGISDPMAFEIMAKEWITLGADIIGGCCRIGPDHIKRLSSLKQSQKNKNNC